MTVALWVLLGAATLVCWFASLSVLRLGAFDRIHAVALVNVAGGAAMAAAVLVADGATVRSAKAATIWIAMMVVGAIGSHVAARAIHLRGGSRR